MIYLKDTENGRLYYAFTIERGTDGSVLSGPAPPEAAFFRSLCQYTGERAILQGDPRSLYSLRQTLEMGSRFQYNRRENSRPDGRKEAGSHEALGRPFR